MKIKGLTSSNYQIQILIVFFTLFLFIFDTSILLAIDISDTASIAKKEELSGDQIFSYIIGYSYLIGVFIMLPWITYTNFYERLNIINKEDFKNSNDISEQESNDIANRILIEINNKLTPIDNGNLTITKGSQARFIKTSIDYIKSKLYITDETIINELNSIIELYQNRTKRLFSGSKWLIGAAVGILLLFAYMGAYTTSFFYIHLLGTIFYILSCRVPLYIVENRLGSFKGNFLGKLLGGFLLGAATTKMYNVYSDGSRSRDHGSELGFSGAALIIVLIVSFIIGFMIALMGIVNFALNYSSNAYLPTKLDTWYERNFATT
jgi:hypothetical protein